MHSLDAEVGSEEAFVQGTEGSDTAAEKVAALQQA
jgi:hypothetical protein